MQASQETPEELRHAFGHLPSGVVAVCALVGGRPVGMAASSFVPVSLKPPLVSFCAARTSRTWEALSRRRASVSACSPRTTGPCAGVLASSAEDRFADVRWQAGESGAVFLPGTVLWLECALDSESRGGRPRDRRTTATRNRIVSAGEAVGVPPGTSSDSTRPSPRPESRFGGTDGRRCRFVASTSRSP
ncbi:flavin reductase family protein [Streptomyces griseorubiginosus]